MRPRSAPRTSTSRAAAGRAGDARGDRVSDAVIGALAIEVGATVATYDHDFARFAGLRRRAPG